MNPEPRTIVTKGEFARLKNRTPQAVSNWIAERKISSAALIGEGNRARLWVERADADLLRALDPSQQTAQERPVGPETSSPQDGTSPTNVVDADILRRKRLADAERAEHDAEAARRKNSVDEGRWVDAAEMAGECAKELAKIKTGFETFLCTTIARDVGEKYAADWKAISVHFRNLYHEHCVGVADDAKVRRSESEPAVAEAAE